MTFSACCLEVVPWGQVRDAGAIPVLPDASPPPPRPPTRAPGQVGLEWPLYTQHSCQTRIPSYFPSVTTPFPFTDEETRLTVSLKASVSSGSGGRRGRMFPSPRNCPGSTLAHFPSECHSSASGVRKALEQGVEKGHGRGLGSGHSFKLQVKLASGVRA